MRSWKTTGRRTLHGFYSNGFPNLFHLGSLQNAPSVNFVHVLDEQAVHVGAVDAECTPGCYNNEGAPHGPRQTYGPGPAAFQRLLREWRTGEGINEVLGDTG